MRDKSVVTIDKFGKDHWSTFAYAECRMVDDRGILNREHMRCNIKRHPQFANSFNTLQPDMPTSPTMLRGHFKDKRKARRGHDDWDCLYDLEAAGLLKLNGTGISPIVELTDYGRAVAGLLRKHKADGGNFSEFTVTP